MYFKEKQVKTDGGEEEIISTIKTSHSTTPTPAQVLSRALNATDTKTTKWFKVGGFWLFLIKNGNLKINYC